jgi:hypothetical protein
MKIIYDSISERVYYIISIDIEEDMLFTTIKMKLNDRRYLDQLILSDKVYSISQCRNIHYYDETSNEVIIFNNCHLGKWGIDSQYIEFETLYRYCVNIKVKDSILLQYVRNYKLNKLLENVI